MIQNKLKNKIIKLNSFMISIIAKRTYSNNFSFLKRILNFVNDQNFMISKKLIQSHFKILLHLYMKMILLINML